MGEKINVDVAAHSAADQSAYPWQPKNHQCWNCIWNKHQLWKEAVQEWLISQMKTFYS